MTKIMPQVMFQFRNSHVYNQLIHPTATGGTYEQDQDHHRYRCQPSRRPRREAQHLPGAHHHPVRRRNLRDRRQHQR